MKGQFFRVPRQKQSSLRLTTSRLHRQGSSAQGRDLILETDKWNFPPGLYMYLAIVYVALYTTDLQEYFD